MGEGSNLHDIKAAYYTLGCKLNFAETSTIGRALESRGVVEAKRGEAPDVCIINTCSVTQMADKKGRALIRRLKRDYPDAALIVTGCYAQLKPEEVAAIEGVDVVVGSNEKLRIPEIVEKTVNRSPDTSYAPCHTIIATTDFKNIEEFVPSCARGDRTRFFLKVQDGCDYFCTYCTIPFARGKSRSGSVEEMVAQARRAASEGGREIVLTGVNVGDFGKTGGKSTGETFFDLIRALDRVEEIERFRISSIEPNLLTEEMIDWVARESRAFMPHFHIPLQSGSDKVLRLMNRRYDTALFASRIEKIRRAVPDAFIGVDIIAGARGETPEEWVKTRTFVSELDITRLHVFPYSERPGTKALLLEEKVPENMKTERVGQLMRISDEKFARFMESNMGTTRKVLWEKTLPGGMLTGLTDNYLRVVASGPGKLLNSISEVRLVGIAANRAETMTAELVK